MKLHNPLHALAREVIRFQAGETFSTVRRFAYGSRVGERDGYEVIDDNTLVQYLPATQNPAPSGTRRHVVATRPAAGIPARARDSETFLRLRKQDSSGEIVPVLAAAMRALEHRIGAADTASILRRWADELTPPPTHQADGVTIRVA